MKKTKLIILLFPVLMLFAGIGAYASLDVTVNLGGGGTDPNELAFASAIETELARYSDLPDLTRAFGNANTYAAANGVTMRGYQGYDLISIAVGTMETWQAPNADVKAISKLEGEVRSEGDVYSGLGINPVVGQIGLNMGFIISDFYLSFRFGKLDYKVNMGNYALDFDTNLFGVLADYQIISSNSILAGILLWKGLNLESGFIYSSNNVVYSADLDPFTINDGAAGDTATLDPILDFEMDIKSYIIPVEIYSAFRLFYMINFGAGVGFDYVYKSKVDLKLQTPSTITITGGSNYFIGTTGDVMIDARSEGKSDKFRPKAMINAGVGMGPVIVDVPVTFYFDNGYAVGVTAGIVW